MSALVEIILDMGHEYIPSESVTMTEIMVSGRSDACKGERRSPLHPYRSVSISTHLPRKKESNYATNYDSAQAAQLPERRRSLPCMFS